jgi:hypothetical protein
MTSTSVLLLTLWGDLAFNDLNSFFTAYLGMKSQPSHDKLIYSGVHYLPTTIAWSSLVFVCIKGTVGGWWVMENLDKNIFSFKSFKNS